MKTAQSEHTKKTNGINTLKFSKTSTFVHMSVAVFFVVMTWGLIDNLYLYNWGGLVIAALLASLLRQAVFKRKSADHAQDLNKWKTNYAYFAAIVSGTLSIGYCYGLILGGGNLATTLGFIMAMHVACVAISCVGSKRVFLASLLTLVAPFIVTLLVLSNPTTIMLAASLTIFTSVLIVLNLHIHRSIIFGFDMTAKQTHQLEESEKLRIHFENASFEDPLTGVYNRRFFDLMISEEIRRTKRAETNLSLAIVEIDSFTAYLDNYGDAKANQCLVSIAEVLEKTAERGSEFITRFEHDKFAIITPNVSTSEVLGLASKMIGLVSQAEIEHHYTLANNLHHVSISVGIAEFKSDNIIDVSEMISQALLALKTARSLGYNNAQVFTSNDCSKIDEKIDAENSHASANDCEVA